MCRPSPPKVGSVAESLAKASARRKRSRLDPLHMISQLSARGLGLVRDLDVANLGIEVDVFEETIALTRDLDSVLM